MSDGRVWKIAGVGVLKLARVGDGWAPQRVGPSHRPRGWVRLQVRVQTQGRPHGGAEVTQGHRSDQAAQGEPLAV